MPTDLIVPSRMCRGEVRMHAVEPTWRSRGVNTSVVGRPGPSGDLNFWFPVTEFQPNDFLYEWATIVGNLLLRRGLNYGIGGMYLEFENVGSPGDPVSAPGFTRDADQARPYYDNLALSADRDYLRVPLVSGALGSSDGTKFPKGNRVSFFAQSGGEEGVHGKPFSAAANSVVFGGALVAFVAEDDPTQDLVLSRFYAAVDRQQAKTDSAQVGLEWQVTLG